MRWEFDSLRVDCVYYLKVLFYARFFIFTKEIANAYKIDWDIPGGSVEEDELPREGAVREAMEEVNQKVQLSSILHEDSCYDDTKGIVFTRLVYKAKLLEYREIKLDLEEHTAFRWIRVLSDMKGEKTVPYLKDILK